MKRRYEPISQYLNPDLKPHMLYALVLVGIIYFCEKALLTGFIVSTEILV